MNLDIAQKILAARDCGVVRCGISAITSPNVSTLAREFGLRDDASLYRIIDEADARQLMIVLLHQDMAYGAEIIPKVSAAELADAFIAQFGVGARYYTNGNWYTPPQISADGSGTGPGWIPATEATFDSGVLAIGRVCSGCLWVEDED